MKKYLMTSILILIVGIIAYFSIGATHILTPHRIGVPVNTTLFWGKDSFALNSATATMIFRRMKFSTSGESTMVFVGKLTATGVLTPAIANCSTVTVVAATAADSTKTFWYLIINKH
jgi:hypothetical protein